MQLAESSGDRPISDPALVARALRVGPSCRSFLREVRLKPFARASIEKKRNKGHFWQAIFEKSRSGPTTPKAQERQQSTNLSLEIGGWINLPYGIHTSISLVVEYDDGQEKQAFKIDSSEAKGAVQILLSGSAEIIADCSVEAVKVYCYGIEDKSVWIENFQCSIVDRAKK